MELRHLRYFVAVAEELHFGRAAARLHISQPPLSQQIMQLEDELGTKLLERDRRHVALTDAGRAFLPEARAVLRRAADAASVARAAASGGSGRLSIGFVLSAGYSVLPEAVRLLREGRPGIQVTLQEMNPARQVRALANRDIDIGILRPPLDVKDLAVRKVLDEPLMAVVPSAHPLAGAGRVSLQKLHRYPLIMFPRRHGPGLYDVIAGLWRSAGLAEPEPAHEPNDMESLLVHVAAGMGVAVVPGSLIGSHPSAIRFLKLTGAKSCIGLCAVWSRDRPSAIRESFIAAMEEAARACITRMKAG